MVFWDTSLEIELLREKAKPSDFELHSCTMYNADLKPIIHRIWLVVSVLKMYFRHMCTPLPI